MTQYTVLLGSPSSLVATAEYSGGESLITRSKMVTAKAVVASASTVVIADVSTLGGGFRRSHAALTVSGGTGGGLSSRICGRSTVSVPTHCAHP